MNNKEYSIITIPQYIFITAAYSILVGMLIDLTIRLKEVPLFYFGLSMVILNIWDRVIPKDKYINAIRYTCRAIYVLFALYALYMLFK